MHVQSQDDMNFTYTGLYMTGYLAHKGHLALPTAPVTSDAVYLLLGGQS